MPRRWYPDPDDALETHEENRRDNEELDYQERPPETDPLFDEWVKLGRPMEFFSMWRAMRKREANSA